MFNTHDISRNACQLFGEQARCGYDWWWHSFTGHHEKTGEERAFFIEFFLSQTDVFKIFLTVNQERHWHNGDTNFLSKLWSYATICIGYYCYFHYFHLTNYPLNRQINYTTKVYFCRRFRNLTVWTNGKLPKFL